MTAATVTTGDGGAGAAAKDDRYKWTALSNTTLGIFMATLGVP